MSTNVSLLYCLFYNEIPPDYPLYIHYHNFVKSIRQGWVYDVIKICYQLLNKINVFLFLWFKLQIRYRRLTNWYVLVNLKLKIVGVLFSAND